MKRLVLLLSIVFSISAFGQDKAVLNNISDVVFYGVDFSKVKVFGADESPEQFKSAFLGINQLFLTEAKKYNVAKFFKKNVIATDQKEVNKRIGEIEVSDLYTSDSGYEIDDSTLKSIIEAFPTDESEGTGLIIVADMLNKSMNRGYYHIVFFDHATKEIVDTWKADARSQGFGLRNFWARTVFDIMKKTKL